MFAKWKIFLLNGQYVYKIDNVFVKWTAFL